MSKDCTHCKNGFRGSDVECVNGVLIDIDEFTEGWQRDIIYRPAPCHPDYCAACKGTGEKDGGDCPKCTSGYVSGKIDCNKRLLEHAGLDA
jgi:hypothetical protein